MTVENGLGPAIDAQCNAATKVEYFYRSTNPATPGFLPTTRRARRPMCE